MKKISNWITIENHGEKPIINQKAQEKVSFLQLTSNDENKKEQKDNNVLSFNSFLDKKQ